MDGSGHARVGRRAMLTAGAAGIVTAVAGALAAPGKVAAGDGDDLVIGKIANVGQSTTWLHTTNNDGFHSKTDGGDAVVAESSAASKSGLYGFSTNASGTGVFGRNNTSGCWGALGKSDKGVHGMSPSAEGVRGQSGTGDGVVGQSDGTGKSGVYGYSSKADGYGVFGRNTGSDTSGFLGGKSQGVRGSAHGAEGVRGDSGTNNGVVGMTQGADRSGVYGYNTNADGQGVHGYNDATVTHGYLGGRTYGVYGKSPVVNGTAVLGEHSNSQGIAVCGANTATNVQGNLGAGGIALLGNAPTNLASAGLYVGGRAVFERSGILTVAKAKSSVSAAVAAIGAGGPMPTMVLATLQTNRAGVYVQSAVLNAAAGKITIYLNKKVSASTKVAYFVLN